MSKREQAREQWGRTGLLTFLVGPCSHSWLFEYTNRPLTVLPIRLRVCMCDCHWSAAHFWGWQGLMGKAVVHPQVLAEGLPGWLLRGYRGPHKLCSWGLCLSAACPPVLGPSEFNYVLLGWIHRWLLWEEACTSPQSSGCSSPQWISRATMKQKLVPSPFFTQPGVRGWPFTPGDSED